MRDIVAYIEKYERVLALAQTAYNKPCQKTAIAIAWLHHFILDYWRFFFIPSLPKLISDERRYEYHEESNIIVRCFHTAHNRPSPSSSGILSRQESTCEYFFTYSLLLLLIYCRRHCLYSCVAPRLHCFSIVRLQ